MRKDHLPAAGEQQGQLDEGGTRALFWALPGCAHGFIPRVPRGSQWGSGAGPAPSTLGLAHPCAARPLLRPHLGCRGRSAAFRGPQEAVEGAQVTMALRTRARAWGAEGPEEQS